jgi:hypothetical protein
LEIQHQAVCPDDHQKPRASIGQVPFFKGLKLPLVGLFAFAQSVTGHTTEVLLNQVPIKQQQLAPKHHPILHNVFQAVHGIPPLSPLRTIPGQPSDRRCHDSSPFFAFLLRQDPLPLFLRPSVTFSPLRCCRLSGLLLSMLTVSFLGLSGPPRKPISDE